LQGVEGLGQLLGLFLGEALEGLDRHIAMMLQHLGELGFVQGRKPGGIFEGMFRGHDHQQQEITIPNAKDLATNNFPISCTFGHSAVVPLG